MDDITREVADYLAACYEDPSSGRNPSKRTKNGHTASMGSTGDPRAKAREHGTNVDGERGQPPEPPRNDDNASERRSTALTTVGPRSLMERPKHPLEELLDANTVDQVMGTITTAGKWLSLFRAHLKLITVLTLFGVVLGAASFWLAPPAARIEFEMVLKTDATDNPVLGKQRKDVEFFRSTPQNFVGLSLIADTLKKLGVEDPSEVQVQGVQENLALKSSGPNSYRGVYSTHNGDEGLTFMKAHVDNYLDSEVEKTLGAIRAEAEFLQGQLSSTQRELRRTEEALIAFKKENSRGTPDAAQSSYARLIDLTRTENGLRSQIAQSELQIELHQNKLEREDPLVESRRLATRPYDAKIIDAEQQLALARARGLGEKHPDVISLIQQIEKLEALAERSAERETEVERTRNTTFEQVSDQMHAERVKLELARKRLLSVQAERKRLEQVVSQLPDLEAEHTDLTRSYQVTQELHDRILEQLKNTELRLELERASASARFHVISPPRLVHASLIKTVGLRGGVLGAFFFALAILLALGTEFRRYSLIRKMEAELADNDVHSFDAAKDSSA